MQLVAIQSHQCEDQSHEENLTQQHTPRIGARHGTGSIFALQGIQHIVGVCIDECAFRDDEFVLLHHSVGERYCGHRLVNFFLGEVSVVEHVLTQGAVDQLGEELLVVLATLLLQHRRDRLGGSIHAIQIAISGRAHHLVANNTHL